VELTGARGTGAASLVPIDEALAVVAAAISPLGPEDVPLEHAHGRFLAAPVEAGLSLPPFTNSAMDGYALRAADTPGRLRVTGESAAGSPFAGVLAPGEAVAISTGAALPAGADAVVPIERVLETAAEEIEVPAEVDHDAWLRHAGSDVEAGARVLAAGVRVGPAQIGAAAAVGVRELRCGGLPRVAIVTTGTELRSPGEALAPGEIYDANGPMLEAALSTTGAIVARIPAVDDTVEAHRAALREALDHDVVISSGGVSVGTHDLVRAVARELGVSERFWRIALRPGKPLSFGVRGSTLVFGLPGNPVSTLVCFELFVRPALYALQGAREIHPAFDTGTLSDPVARNSVRDEMIRVRRTAGGRLEPLSGQQSHQITIMAQADGLARIPAGTGELAGGSEVSYLPLHRF
jgi:molybdopterin molybdotransferase